MGARTRFCNHEDQTVGQRASHSITDPSLAPGEKVRDATLNIKGHNNMTPCVITRSDDILVGWHGTGCLDAARMALHRGQEL